MLKTAECVSPKHSDKMCDQISDAILDECLAQDSESRVAIETMGGHGIITITGELTSNAYVNMRDIAQKVAGGQYGVQINVVRQSLDIARGVSKGGAGDQGIMIGYACNENEEMIPQEMYLARKLCKFIYKKYKEDGKTQITIAEDNKIVAVVASFCNVSEFDLKTEVDTWLEIFGIDYLVTTHINPAGDWSNGGFEADTGVTGRKIVVDNYGPRIPIGGGAFSGKDATKVDRSGAYRARQLAVQILKKRKCKEVLVKIAYAIGVENPVEVTAIVDAKESIEIKGEDFIKCRPAEIIKNLDLKKPQFTQLAKWGYFNNKFKWNM